ncbi:hypothetical protein [Halovivax gelatinilyticus]|uniref:hypothetical protein n=1 Tax=Halovivax gelatinilyticus TaxID=2961597 RepID=UPI0020CA6E5E|nr:hypothetical protein [Halovivax gelatinilyticus]
MRSTVESVGAAEQEAPVDRTCYRCDRDVATEYYFRLSATPRSATRDRFRPVTRTCCPDCVAALGLLEFDERWLDAIDRR